MKNEHQFFYKIMRYFEGMQKIDVLDILHEMEILLLHAASPITKDNIRKVISYNIKKDQKFNSFTFTILPNGNFCQRVGTNDWLSIYLEQKRSIYSWSIFDTYYFRIKHPLSKIQKLTKRNLLESFQNTSEEVEILDFLRKNKSFKGKKFIKKLLLFNVEIT